MSAPRALRIAVVAMAGIPCMAVLKADTTDETAAEALLSPGTVDESAFREGLRRRGLTDWLAQHDADNPPGDAIDARLRRRDALLAEIETGDVTPYVRRKTVAEARAILSELLASETRHPGRLDWLLASAVDVLDRTAPEAFDAVLIYELAGRDRRDVAEFSAQTVTILAALRHELEAAWSAVEKLDEQSLAERVEAGVLERLEVLDTRSALMLAWARLYHAMTAEMPETQRQAAYLDLLDEITQRRGWTELDESHPALACETRAMAAVAARGAGRTDEAIEHARQLVSTYRLVRDPVQRRHLRPLTLLAVLEQIRARRDAGQRSEALTAVDTARQWVTDSREDDLSIHLALELAECAIMAGPSWRENLFGSSEALVPLTMWMLRSPERRDVAYAVLADTPITRETPLLQVQWTLGGAIHDVRTRQAPDAWSSDARLQEVMAVAARRVEELIDDDDAPLAAETAYLLGRGHITIGRPLEAVGHWCHQVERWPTHDRSDETLRRAVAGAQQCLEQAGCGDLAQARTLFVRAGRLMRNLRPSDPVAQRLAYPIARVLEQADQWREASDAYREVEPDDPHAVGASLGRARCLHRLFEHHDARGTTDEATLARQAESALRAAEEGLTFVRQRSAEEPSEEATCAEAQLALFVATLCNQPFIARPARTVEALADFEQRFAACPDRSGIVLNERIIALKRLQRLEEARHEVETLATQDRQRSGPVMIQLLETMRTEIDAAADRGQETHKRETAAEAVRVAEMLLTWMEDYPTPTLARDRLTVRVWRAQALLQAGRADEALIAYEECAQNEAELLETLPSLAAEVRLGRAECLAALQRWEEALPHFAAVRGQTPEESPFWWRAFVGQLECHRHLGSEAVPIVQAIRQRRYLSPSLGAPRWKRRLDVLESALLSIEVEANASD